MTIPASSLRVSDAERDEAVTAIQAAYADGRIDESVLERHLDLALTARTRVELLQALEGIRRPEPQLGWRERATWQPPAPVATTGYHLPARGMDRNTAHGLTHLSALPFSIFGPGAVWLWSSPGTDLRREAAKAVNFQAIILAASLAAGFVGLILNVGWFSGFVGLVWFVLTVVSGVKAFRGEPWENPVTAIVGKRLVSEEEPRSAR